MADSLSFDLPAGQRALLIDDGGIVVIDGLVRTAHQPAKRGAVIRSADPSQTVQTRSAPAWDADAGCYKLWLLGVDQPLYQSHDGLHWTPGPKPDLRTDLVVYDPLDPEPTRRFKAVLLNTGFAVSADGVAWTRLDLPAIASSDEGNLSYAPRSRRFIHTVKRAGPFGRSVAVATSTDFAHWQDYGIVFQTDELDQEIGRERIAARRANRSLKQTEYDTPEHYSIETYNMGVFWYEGLFIGLPSVYHHTGKVPPGWPGFDRLRLSPYILDCVGKHGDYTGFYNVQLASSRDLVNWHRLPGRPAFLETSPLGAGAYDTQTIIGPSSPVVRGDELWFYYTGTRNYAFTSSGGLPGYDDYVPDKGGICLAVLRRDGFVSLDAGRSAGTLQTAPFALPGDRLWVNVDAAAGELLVEVLDQSGAVVAVSAGIAGDHPRIEVPWQRGHLAAAPGSAVSLRFVLRQASLYSYWVEASGPTWIEASGPTPGPVVAGGSRP